MLTAIAIRNYRSILDLKAPLSQLTVITGPNGSGKSNLYKSLRLLAETARGGVVHSLAREGGLESTFWAGPEKLTRSMKAREVEVQGGPRQSRVQLQLGFASDAFSYSITLGLPVPSTSAFSLDPEIKREVIWHGSVCRPASSLVERKGPMVRARDGRQWRVIHEHTPSFTSLFDTLADPVSAPEVFQLREFIRQWRFYDHFRTDKDAPARQPQLGTRTPVLSQDGHDLAAAIQTIMEIGDKALLDGSINDAFPGASIHVGSEADGRFTLYFQQEGLLRPLTAAELSDGTLRYLLLMAALLSPRPPSLMILNEPETSLHPDLLPALARLIARVSEETQVWVVSHASRLIAALNKADHCHSIELEKEFGATKVVDQGMLDEPPWQW
ncbi:AAA family ATPase [Reinekea blandensis]|uniref:Predicted ATPase n=1 Tax=Reinekea blandensis MED297 TaxID=314283 RepID=A4BBV7_9GAMM|nr:AAA family ATPase [Reinekea blandensis]EAR10442.1 predicted ATPase [Reinekea sp. MED297] [Reinekea blandensis MED297]